MGRRRRQKNKTWPIAVVILLLAGAGGGAWLFLSRDSGGQSTGTNSEATRSSQPSNSVDLTIGSELWLLEPDLSNVDDVVSRKVLAARDAVRADTQSAEAWGAYGMVLHGNGMNQYAEFAYKRAARLETAEFRWPYLAALAIKDRDPIGALVLLEEAAAYQPEGIAFYVHYAEALANARRIEAATTQYRKALEITPKCSQALIGLSEFAGERGDVQQQLSLLRQAADAEPGNGEVHAKLGALYEQLGDQRQAELCRLRARRFSAPLVVPDQIMADVRREDVRIASGARQVQALLNSHQFVEAEAQCRALLERSGDNPQYMAMLGSALLFNDRPEEAASYLEDALTKFPNDAGLHHQLGKTLYAQGRQEEGLGHLRQSAALAGDDAEMQTGLGAALLDMGRLDDAHDVFMQALEADPSSVQALIDLGVVLRKQGRNDEALEQWQRAISIDPLQGECYYQMGSLLAEMGEYRRAMDHLRKALGLRPNDPTVVATIAWHLAASPIDALRNGQEAVTFGRVIYDRFPNSGPAMDLYAAAQAERGHYEEAAQLAERAVAAFEAAGQPDRAEKAQKRLELYRQRLPFRFEVEP